MVYKKYILKFHFVYTIYKIYIIQTQSASPNVDLSLKSFLWNRLFQKWLSLNILAIWRQEAIRKLGRAAFSHLCPSRASQRLSLPIMAPPRGRSRARSGFVPLLSYHGRIVHPAHFSYLYLYLILSHLVLLIVLLPLKNYPTWLVQFLIDQASVEEINQIQRYKLSQRRQEDLLPYFRVIFQDEDCGWWWETIACTGSLQIAPLSTPP